VANTGGPYNANLKKTIQFNGNPSNDSDGQILIYFWDFGDGTTALGPRPTHQYASPGVYSVSLTVRDNLGAMDTATSTVTIRPINRSSGLTH
jgi:microbial collagenase